MSGALSYGSAQSWRTWESLLPHLYQVLPCFTSERAPLRDPQTKLFEKYFNIDYKRLGQFIFHGVSHANPMKYKRVIPNV